MDMVITHRPEGYHVKMSGQFTFGDNQKFKQLLDSLQAQPADGIELDFGAVHFIDSAGLGMLLLLRDVCSGKNIPITLSGAQGQVEKIFGITKFNQLFSIRP